MAITTPNAPAANAPTAGPAAPDFSGLVSAGANAPAPPAPTLNQPVEQPNAAPGNAAPQNPPQTFATRESLGESAAPPKHATLLKMIEGIGVALSSSATAMATKGKEGGAPEVQQYYANKQAGEIKADQERREQMNEQQQMQLTAMQTNEAMGRMYMLSRTLPEDIELHDLTTQNSIDAEKIEHGALQSMAQSFGLPSTQSTGTTSSPTGSAATSESSPSTGTAPVLNDAQVGGDNVLSLVNAYRATQGEPSFNAQQWTTAGGTVLPDVKNPMQSLSNQRKWQQGQYQDAYKFFFAPLAAPTGKTAAEISANAGSMESTLNQQLQTYKANPDANPAVVNALQSRLARYSTVARDAIRNASSGQSGIATSQALDAFESNPKTLEGPSSTAAVSQLQGIVANSDDPQVRVRASKLLGTAVAAHQAYLSDQSSLAAAKAIATENAQTGGLQGAVSAGQQLATSGMTLSDLRYATRNQLFVQAAIQYALKGNSDPKLGPVFQGNPQFNAAQYEIYAQQAKAPANLAFFGSANSLIQTGGTLDQLTDIGAKISQSDYKLLNKTKNWASLESGSGPIAGYAATAVGVADDYGKVMGGGVGSDTARGLILKAIDPSLGPAQRAEAIKQFRSSVNSQVQGRIGRNPYLRVAWSNASEVGTGSTVNPSAPSLNATPNTSVANPSAIPGLTIH